MTEPIRISGPKAGPDEPKRLNPFPGRYLSEREFELLQAYVDDRISPLIATLAPGIISGLEVLTEGSGSDTSISIQSGLAIGAEGHLIRLFYPSSYKWPDLVGLTRTQRSLEKLDPMLPDGLYWLTLKTVVEAIDDEAASEPSTRAEPNPLRQRRLETVALPGLQLIPDTQSLLMTPQARAANRICVRFLNESPFDATTAAVPLALIKVTDELPQWVDTVAGRYLSEPKASVAASLDTRHYASGSRSAYRTFLCHYVARVQQWLEKNEQGDAHTALGALLDVDYLPAAGPLPSILLKDPAGEKPTLAFDPADLQVELSPVPASTIAAVIDRELPRGSVGLVHGMRDRIRLLLAIPDIDYRPDLMDIPQRDSALEDTLNERAAAAATTWEDSWNKWHSLFGGLSADQLKSAGAPTLPDAYPGAPKDARPNPEAPTEGLFKRIEAMRDSVRQLEHDLNLSFGLLDEIDDYLNLQRQQLDSITTSFSTLAGGVAGDGSGFNLMRWNKSVEFEPSIAKG